MAQVHVVDDDEVVLRSISRVLDAAGIEAVEWSSPLEFLHAAQFTPPTCILLDVRMPALTGTEVQEELRRRRILVPVVFLTAHGDVPTSVLAMKGGADDFLLKPVDPPLLLEVVRRSLQRNQDDGAAAVRYEALRNRLETLTPREREVLEQVVRGASNREGASALGIAENTVKVHRVRLMAKMGAESLPDLVQMALTLGILPQR